MTKNNAPNNMDITAFVAEVENSEDEVERTNSNKKVMGMKGVSDGHHRRALKTEDAFFNGLGSVGKFVCVTLRQGTIPINCSNLYSFFSCLINNSEEGWDNEMGKVIGGGGQSKL